jgi:hypothetical protein
VSNSIGDQALPVAASDTTDQDTVDDFRLHDEVRVGTRLDGHNISFRGTVIGVQDLELWVGLADVDEQLARLEPGQPLNVATPRGTRALVVDTTFTRHIGSRRGRLFATTRPGEVRATQLRAYIRLEAAIAVKITVYLRGRLLSEVARTVDISAGGTCFESRLPLTPGDRLTLQLRDGLFSASADADVVRVDAADPALGRPVPWIAVQFVSIVESDQDGITRYIYSEARRRL